MKIRLRKSEPTRFVPPSWDKEDGAYLLIRKPTQRKRAEIEDKRVTFNTKGGDATFRSGTVNLELALEAVVGWHNLQKEDGTPFEYTSKKSFENLIDSEDFTQEDLMALLREIDVIDGEDPEASEGTVESKVE